MTHSFAPHYNYFRDYEPAIGRYPQSDPIGLDGGLNTYQYADANPVSVFDSLGLKPGDIFPSNAAAEEDRALYEPLVQQHNFPGLLDPCWIVGCSRGWLFLTPVYQVLKQAEPFECNGLECVDASVLAEFLLH